MKKFLLPVGIFAVVAAGAGAETFKNGPYTFETTGESTVELSSVASKNESNVAYDSYDVPATVENGGKTYTVTAIGEAAFRWNYAKSITIPATIETIGYQAFSGASNITSIVLPDGLKSIEDYAFSSTGLKSIDIPGSVESIGSSVFFTCNSLTSVTLHEGLKTVGISAFYKAPITSIEFPSTVEYIGNKAFLYCSKLTSVKLPAGITELGEGCFMGCTSLASVTLPEGLTSIGLECFLQCPISEITIPASVETLGTSVFACTNVSTINLASGNKNFTLVDGVLYGADKKLLYAVPMKGKQAVNVDPKCIGINGGAFWGSEVAKVTLPEGLLAIDDYAFCQSSLAEINFPSSLTFIGEQGFAATQLTDVTLPVNMPYVYDGAFAGCANMTSLTIPSGVKLIYNHAFHNNSKLASVTCLGSEAPEIDEVYETYDSPFFGISESTPLYIPKGSLQSYKDAGWGSYFTIVEGESSALSYVNVTPGNGTVFGKYADMKVEIEFESEISIVSASPEVYLRKGSELSGAVIEPDDEWKATSGGNNKTVRIWASDYDGYTQYFTPEEDAEYYLIIPAGVVKNTAGDVNERIVIRWYGPSAPKPIEVVSTTPANGSTLPSGYFNMEFTVEFADGVTIIDYGPDAVLRESDAVSGKKIDPDLGWKAVKEGDNTVRLWASDYDGFVQSFKVNDAIKYYMTIPAGIVKNAAGDKNEEIVIELNGATAGIDGINADNDLYEVERYDLNGRKVTSAAKGIMVVKMSDGTVRKVVVK